MKILIVEDDITIASVLKEGLLSDSYSVEIAENGQDATFLARSYDFDAVILDYSLPKKDGLTVCKELRTAGNNTPIIFLSVFDDIDLKVQALDNGADDYMTKPFSMKEMRARIKAILRRPENIKESHILTIDDLMVDTNSHQVFRAGKEIRLTRKEFCLLVYMLRNKGVVLSRTMIMEHVWSADSDPFSNTVEAHIRNLRKKISIPDKDELIRNVSGRGYMIKE